MTDKIKVIISNKQKTVKIPTGVRMLVRRCCLCILFQRCKSLFHVLEQNDRLCLTLSDRLSDISSILFLVKFSTTSSPLFIRLTSIIYRQKRKICHIVYIG